MRPTISILSFLAFATGLSAGQQTVSLTPQSLTGWTLIGAESQALFGQAGLTLPANAQLARSFAATDLAVQIMTQPVIEENSGDWPVLELGTVALVFSRSGATGQLILVIGDQAPQALPVTFALDAEGRSVDPLSIGLSQNGENFTVMTAGRELQFPKSLSAGPTLEIVASAGTTLPWSIPQLSVTVKTAHPVELPSQAGLPAPDSSAATSVPSDQKAAGDKSAASEKKTEGPGDPAGEHKASAPVNAPGPVSTLEIYTPPSVRHGRAGAVRAAVQTPVSK